MAEFNPDSIGIANGNFFGLPCSEEEADTIIIQVPWDATASYGKGTADGPSAMLEASLQIDLFDERIPGASGIKVWTLPESQTVRDLNSEARIRADKVISMLEQGASQEDVSELCEQVNRYSARINEYVYRTAARYLSQGLKVVLVGGEHSVPLGCIKAVSEHHPGMGVLHIDAHSDTRVAYEGFTHSHASIMYNVFSTVKDVSSITQVAIRDFCSSEYELITSEPRFHVFTDSQIKESLYRGQSWHSICEQIVSTLPQKVYISFDIDGLSPEYCPGTGTPVPGGLDFSQADYLIHTIIASGRRIVGFDLCEVAPGKDSEWDANTGSRLLFKLLLHMASSEKKND